MWKVLYASSAMKYMFNFEFFLTNCLSFCKFLCRIDMKMSDTQGGYKLDEAQAILSEMKAIKKLITSGEKEKQDLIQVLK